MSSGFGWSLSPFDADDLRVAERRRQDIYAAGVKVMKKVKAPGRCRHQHRPRDRA